MFETFLTGVFIALLLGLIPAAIAHAKGHDFALFWLYGVLLLIVATPHAILLTPDRRRLDQLKAREGYGLCTFCSELVRKKAVKCPHCQSSLLEHD